MQQKNNENTHELVIIGAGPGGYRAAFMAADLGIKVTLIDPEKNPGGLCLYRGCIPTKALLNLVKIKKAALNAKSMGIHFDSPSIEIKEIALWKNEVVQKLTGGIGQLVKAHKINYLKGYAHFIDSKTLEFEDEGGQKQKIYFRNAIIATGVTALELPGIKNNGKSIIGPTKALELTDIPEELLIVGGGYIGLEMAVIYEALGSSVSVVELTDGFLPGMDRDMIDVYNKISKTKFKEVFLSTSLKKVSEEKKHLNASFEDKKGKRFNKTYNKILIAIGAKPDHSKLALENTDIETDEDGFIKVDQQQKTSVDGILAIGDVTGGPLLAHKATYEGRLAAEVVAGKKVAFDAKVIPSVIYTQPEIAVCGLSETEAKRKEIPYKIVKFPWSASGRAATMNNSTGFTKLLVDPDSERILGAGIIGEDAGNVIPELALAIEMGATASDLALTIHPHPSLSETVMEAAELYLGFPAHTINKKKISK
jgi:dihydrolipoamide dehydrogenase